MAEPPARRRRVDEEEEDDVDEEFDDGIDETFMDELPEGYDQLTPEQHRAIRIATTPRTRTGRTFKNLLLLGEAGTGKTFVIKMLRMILENLLLRRRANGCFVMSATTQNAASLYDADNICKLVGFTVYYDPEKGRIFGDEKIKDAKAAMNVGYILILGCDEISMMGAPMLMYLDSHFRRAKKIDKPFGGIQVIFCGDFMQLPPVPLKYPRSHKMHGQTEYVFHTALWNELFSPPNGEVLVLQVQKRQEGDVSFLNLLRKIRMRRLKAADYRILKSRERSEPPEDAVCLCPRKDKRDGINLAYLNALQGEEHTFNGAILKTVCRLERGSGKHGRAVVTPANVGDRECPFRTTSELEDRFKVPLVYKLKEGARVVVCANSKTDRMVCNGNQGVFLGFSEDEIGGPRGRRALRILLDKDGLEHLLYERDAEVKVDTGNPREEVKYSYVYYPILLGKAITINVSQGMTLDRVHVMEGSFLPYAFYTACSRVCALDKLTIERLVPEQIIVCDEVLEYYTKKLGISVELDDPDPPIA